VIQSFGYIITRGKYSIPQRVSGSRMHITRDAEDMDGIAVFEDMRGAQSTLSRLKKEHPGKDLHIMHAAFTCTLSEP
jgi:hypothetical protein